MCFSMIVLLSCSPIFVLTPDMLFIFLFILYFLFLFCQLRPNTMCYWLFASFFLPFFYCNSILTILSLRSLKIFKKILYTSITDLLHNPRKVIFHISDLAFQFINFFLQFSFLSSFKPSRDF